MVRNFVGAHGCDVSVTTILCAPGERDGASLATEWLLPKRNTCDRGRLLSRSMSVARKHPRPLCDYKARTSVVCLVSRMSNTTVANAAIRTVASILLDLDSVSTPRLDASTYHAVNLACDCLRTVDETMLTRYRALLNTRLELITCTLALYDARVEFRRARDHLRRLDCEAVDAYLHQDHPFLLDETRRDNHQRRRDCMHRYQAAATTILRTKNYLRTQQRLERRMKLAVTTTDEDRTGEAFRRLNDMLCQIANRVLRPFEELSGQLAGFDGETPPSPPPQSVWCDECDDDSEEPNLYFNFEEDAVSPLSR